jgi:hypothetical protein
MRTSVSSAKVLSLMQRVCRKRVHSASSPNMKCSELSEVGVVMSSYKGAQLNWGNLWGAGKGNGEGVVSLQATWDQGGRGSHHTERRDSK